MSVPEDFPAAIIATLEQNGVCASAFGHTPRTPKFFGNVVVRAELPYARVVEIGESSTYQSVDGSGQVFDFPLGELQIDVFAASESQARQLGKYVAFAINDAPLIFTDGQCLECRLNTAMFVPEPDAGIGGTSAVYHRVLRFQYRNQQSINANPGPAT